MRALLNFLDRCTSDTEGRSLSFRPASDAAEKLERFARGECDSAERAEVCEMLRLHPAWLRWLADRVKHARAVLPLMEGTALERSASGAELA